jgi:hypothetical protein
MSYTQDLSLKKQFCIWKRYEVSKLTILKAQRGGLASWRKEGRNGLLEQLVCVLQSRPGNRYIPALTCVGRSHAILLSKELYKIYNRFVCSKVISESEEVRRFSQWHLKEICRESNLFCHRYSSFWLNNIVTYFLRARIVESQQPAVARQKPVNNNNKTVLSVRSAPAMTSCNNWGIAIEGVSYWVLAGAI